MVAPILTLPVSEVRPDLAKLVPGGPAQTTGILTSRVDRLPDVACQRFGQGPKVLSHPAYLIIGRHGMSL
jgi:hypothetical protein